MRLCVKDGAQLLTIYALLLLSCFSAHAQQTNEQIQLRAMVKEVIILTQFSGTVFPVDGVPYFAATMRIETCTPADTNFATGSNVTFAIHSPSRLFPPEDPKGKTYDFSVRRATEEGKTRYSELKIEKEKENKSATPNPDPKR